MNQLVSTINQPAQVAKRTFPAENQPVPTMNPLIPTINQSAEVANPAIPAMIQPVPAVNQPSQSASQPVLPTNQAVREPNQPAQFQNSLISVLMPSVHPVADVVCLATESVCPCPSAARTVLAAGIGDQAVHDLCVPSAKRSKSHLSNRRKDDPLTRSWILQNPSESSCHGEGHTDGA